ncbi:MAG: hypothetical protein LQ345_006484 [Seirophora villosa]|nr:MAG: hypothetical protein LQ345_006484 [Seirophora villosa]
MRLDRNVLSALFCALALYYHLAASVPVQAASVPALVDNDHGTPSLIQSPATTNNSIDPPPAVNAKANSSHLSFLANHHRTPHSKNLQYTTVIWALTDTLSLTINIGPWSLPPERILACLEAADVAAGKKIADRVLEGKFIQRQGSSRINVLLFEIGPEAHGMQPNRLTWGDVALMLAPETGLPAFFRREKYWTSIYFDVVHADWGRVGEGAVRKWYQ